MKDRITGIDLARRRRRIVGALILVEVLPREKITSSSLDLSKSKIYQTICFSPRRASNVALRFGDASIQMNWTRIPDIPSMITVATIAAAIGRRSSVGRRELYWRRAPWRSHIHQPQDAQGRRKRQANNGARMFHGSFIRPVGALVAKPHPVSIPR